MPFKPFLTAEEIADLQAAEAASDKKQKRPAEQIEAIYSSGSNILVSASAGSGKTFVMVERIMDKLLRGVTIDQLFISTFTVKAASELKERLEGKIAEHLQQVTDANVKQFLSEQLSHIQTADIGTMDAFTQKLVSQYGYTLGISPTFRIMTDKSELDILKKDVFDDLFADYRQGKSGATFTKLVKNFAGNRKDSNNFRQLVYQIYDFSQATDNPKRWLQENLLRGAQQPWEEQVDAYLALYLSPETFTQQLEAAEFFFKHHLETVRNEFQKSYKYLDMVEEVLAVLGSMSGTDDLDQLKPNLERLIQLSGQLTMRVGATKDEELKAFSKAYNADRPTYLQPFLDAQQALFRLDVIANHQAETLPLLEILQQFVLDFSDQYLQLKLQENAFEFSDIAHFAIAILEENADIRKLYQNKYHEVMVDEYQDNNHTQERMLELLSNGHNRFMVGDIKQSIYRFRQADPQIFNQKFKDFQENPEHGKLILLKENFRSQSEVLDSTNSIFTHLMDETIGEILYDDTHQLVAGSDRQKESHPQNETQLLIYDTDQAEELSPDDDNSQISPAEVKLVAKEIIRLHNEEKVPFEDITLLVASRTRNDGIVQTFDRYGIPLVADGGEQNYLKSVEVMVMLDTLRAIDNPLNDYALVALMRSPMFAFDEDDLARLALQNTPNQKQNLYEKLLNARAGKGEHADLVTRSLASKLTAFLDIFQSWRDFAKMHALYDVIWKIYNDKFYYDYVGALPRAEQRQANLYALALRANQFEKNGFKGLSRFIRMIDRILENENDLADVEVALPKNAVSLMTIHKSKGLEFPYVFILNSDKTFSVQDTRSSMILSRDNGIGIKYVADMKEELEEKRLPRLNVSLETLPYQLNRRQLRLATLSEQMRLLYVAMTRAEKKLYLVGKGSSAKLADKYSGESENNHLPVAERENYLTFQDWILAVQAAYPKENLHLKTTFVTDADLTEEKIGQVILEQPYQPDNLKDNRQSDDISRALDMLDAVDQLNERYQAAINLPTVRTPSQIKKFYEPVMETEGVEIMEKSYVAKPKFDLPDFSQKKQVSATALGSAVHELMQRLTLSQKVTITNIMQALGQLSVDDDVKARIQVDKILAFFETSDLGKLLQKHVDRVHREAPFAMLKEDPVSKEKFVVRGIIDGFILLDDRIILFDYKTDKFTNANDIKQRYAGQMALYAEALQKSYQVNQVDKYLILLGGENLEVVAL